MDEINITSAVPTNEKPLSRSDENWEALPQRLRGRGDWLLERGRIKEAELMFDAATETEGLRLAAIKGEKG